MQAVTNTRTGEKLFEDMTQDTHFFERERDGNIFVFTRMDLPNVRNHTGWNDAKGFQNEVRQGRWRRKADDQEPTVWVQKLFGFFKADSVSMWWREATNITASNRMSVWYFSKLT